MEAYAQLSHLDHLGHLILLSYNSRTVKAIFLFLPLLQLSPFYQRSVIVKDVYKLSSHNQHSHTAKQTSKQEHNRVPEI